MNEKHKIVKYACYTASASMSVVSALSPLLFLTFRKLYGLSFSMLGALVLVNFCTQLAVDLIFSFYSHKFNIEKTVKLMPVLTVVGLILYAVLPLIFPGAVYAGLMVGTVIFSASGGLGEVLISPVIAEIPAKNPQREMSRLHSAFAWGVVAVILISTVFLLVFGMERWYLLALMWTVLPLISAALFSKAEIPPLSTPEKALGVLSLIKTPGFLLLFFCMFFGGASECTMSQWSSGYLEQAFNIPKIWGDVFGVAMFSVMLGMGRTLYSKIGRNIHLVLLLSAVGATVCYIIAALSAVPAVGLVSCAMTGLCTAVLWPGTLTVAADKFSSSGVAVFALMAAGGDLGGALGPQTVGTVTDLVLESSFFSAMAENLNFTPEQLGIKVGLISAALFPAVAVALYTAVYKKNKQ